MVLAVGIAFFIALLPIANFTSAIITSSILAIFVCGAIILAGKRILFTTVDTYKVEIVDNVVPTLPTQPKNTLLIASIVGITAFLAATIMSRIFQIPTSWLNLAFMGFGFSAVSVFFVGLNWKERIQTRHFPNQGIYRSFRFGISMGLMITITAILIFGIGLAPLGLAVSISVASLLGFFFGIGGFLRYGGFTQVKHYSLRLLLSIIGHTPVRLVSFLDYASDLTFLQSLEGPYKFTHVIIMEHFASIDLEENIVQRILQLES